MQTQIVRGYPGSGPASRLGASGDVPGEGLTRGAGPDLAFMARLIKARGAEMNEMCDRCGPAVAAVYRVERHGELYLCRHCTNRLWAALFAQGWTIWPAAVHALAPQANECSGASCQRTRRGRGSGGSPRILRCRFRRLRALALVCWRGRSRRVVLSG
jgi:hypothetical protein